MTEKERKNAEPKKALKTFTCRLPSDPSNLRAVRGWLQFHTREGKDTDLSANKRTMLRLFGHKKKK